MRTPILLGLLMLLLTAAFPAAAAVQADSFTLSPLIGWHQFEGDTRIDDDLTFGLALGYNYTRHWGTELFFNFTPTEAETNGNSDVDLYNYSINGLYHFLPDAPLVPYLTVGAGAITLDPDDTGTQTDFALNYGVGVKWFFTDNLALRGDVRHVIGFAEGVEEWNPTDNNLLMTAGLTLQFGAPEPAPAPAVAPAPEPAPAPAPPPAPAPAPAVAPPADQDGDGVPDTRDECPDTPKGVPVDERGCPRDSDQDGVPDDLDKCPNTQRGVMVDEKGCPISLEIHIEFDFDKAEIKPEFYSELQRAADFIQKNPAPKILVAGHTDSIGTYEYNQELSLRRAAAVRNFLAEKHGVDPEKMVARGYGETRPIETNETPEGRQRNRRTEIVCCVFIPED